MSETAEDREPDQDYAAAEAPHGFAFGRGEDGAPALSPVQQSDEFPAASQEAVDGLLWLGYLTDEFPLFGHRYAIRTLTRGDRLAIALVTNEWAGTLGEADAYQTATVAAALLAVDDEPIADLDMAADPAERVRRSFARVKKWYDPVVEELFQRVAVLNQKQLAAFARLQSKS
jgi:hypothetical protein